MGWSGKKNGDLLTHAGAAGFDAVITMDSGVQYQQNMATLPVSVVILSADSNDMDDLRPLLGRLLQALETLQPKTVTRIP
jgi:hypothetical protein